MVKLLSISIFTRLYLIIAITVIVSGTLSFVIIDKFNRYYDIEDSVVLTDYLYEKLLASENLSSLADVKALDGKLYEFKGYLMGWQIQLEKKPPCDDCTLIGNSGEAEVYQDTYVRFYTSYKLPNINAWVTIIEIDNIFWENDVIVYGEEDQPKSLEKPESNYLDLYSFNNLADISLLAVVLISVIAGVYWPIRVVQRQIEALVEINQRFGEGDLQMRAGEHFTKPLDELATSFNHMSSTLCNTVKESQIFAQAVPHEVRTPLSRIQLAVGLLRVKKDPDTHDRLLNDIDNYIDDLNELISQIVAFSKINAAGNDGVSADETIELSTFIESRIAANHCEESVKVKRHIESTLLHDTNQVCLRLLVDNILKNACNYARTQISVSLVKANNTIELIIEDDGNGIPDESITSIFLPFSRLDNSRNRNTGGLGLGLAIAKAACNQLNCQLTVENVDTGGAKFTCQFTTIK